MKNAKSSSKIARPTAQRSSVVSPSGARRNGLGFSIFSRRPPAGIFKTQGSPLWNFCCKFARKRFDDRQNGPNFFWRWPDFFVESSKKKQCSYVLLWTKKWQKDNRKWRFLNNDHFSQISEQNRVKNPCCRSGNKDEKALPFRLASLGKPLNFFEGGTRDFRTQFWAF